MATMAGEGEGRHRPTPRTDLPEVDRIIRGCKFRRFSTNQVLSAPDKLGELAARTNIVPPLPSLDNVDCISKLPDDILKSIISLLTMREAAATSVLSFRWRYLWTTSLSCLNFDLPNMLGHDYPNVIFEKKSQAYITRKRSRFTKWVNHVIMHLFNHSSSRLDALRVSFILNTDSASDIDTWITSAVARGVTEIHFDFHYNIFYGNAHNPHKEYVFPAQQVASTIRYLHLKFCKLNLPPDFTGFTSLVSLSLFYVHVTQTLMENILLSKCPLLEFLSMDDCYHPDNTSFEFAGTSLRLKHLRIGMNYGITSIKVHNINLLSFELDSKVPKLSIRNAPQLARLALLMTNPEPDDIMSDTPRLETLFLIQHYEKTCNVDRHPYVLNNLKRLVFVATGLQTTNILGVVHILKECYLLQKLELDMGITEEKERSRNNPDEIVKRLNALPGFPLNNLKEIEIYGFEVYPEKIALAVYLLDNAVVLQKMKIYTTSKVYCGDGQWEPRVASLEKVHKAELLEKVHKDLQDIAHSSTKVELFSSLNL